MKITYTYRLLLLVACSLLASVYTYADDGNATKGFDFIENKGQWPIEVRFRTDVQDGVVFITDRGFVYSYVNPEDVKLFDENHNNSNGFGNSNELTSVRNIHHHAYRVNFVGANTSVRYEGGEKRDYYYNYFVGNDSSKWRGNVGLFGSVTQKNIYNGIDVVIYSKGKDLKYDFVVDAGKLAAQIRLSFDGVVPQLTKEGHLKIKTSVNEIIEQAPYAYQMINGTKVTVKCHYKLNDGIVTFVFPVGYNMDYPLVIDPTVVFATYSGATWHQKYAYASTYDVNGNLYNAGHDANIAGGWPTNLGAFQTTPPLGDRPIVIAKYNATGTSLIYATYFGPARWPHALTVSATGELYMLGGTEIDPNMPVTPGCYDNTLGGTSDLFIVHFNSAGSALIGSSFIGGSGVEGITGAGDPNLSELILDASGNIWGISFSMSTDFPITANAYQSTHGGGTDGVLFKLNGTCSQLLYSTFLGGNGNDLPRAMTFNHVGNIVVAGETNSSNFPTTNAAMKTTAIGNTDGFVSIFNPNSGAILQSTYIGTSSNDAAHFLSLDASDNIYVLGTTQGNYRVSGGVYSISNGDIFIDKIRYDLGASLKSTRIGNDQTSGKRFDPSGFILDRCENIYITGLQADTNSPVTAGAIQSTHTSFWVGVIERDFSSLLYGSFFGPAGASGSALHKHPGQQRFDPNGTIYHSVCSNSQNFPTTTGSFSPTKQNASGDVDIVSFKIDLSEFTKIDTFSTLKKMNACFRDSVFLYAKDTSGIDFVWSTGMKRNNISVRQSGLYIVSYRKKGQPCNRYIDSFIVDIAPLPKIITTLQSCAGLKEGSVEVITLPSNRLLYRYRLTIGGITIIDKQSNQGLNSMPLASGSYKLQVISPSGCDTSIAFIVKELPVPGSAFVVDSVICIGQTLSFINRAEGDFTNWYWRFGDGNNSTTFSPVHTYTATGTYTAMLSMQNDYCSDTFSQQITVYDFNLNLTANTAIADFNNTITLETSAKEYYTVYSWQPERLFTDQTTNTQQIKADSSRSYVVFGRSEYGCIDSAEVYVKVGSLPFMPSAFTPNGDGKNDYFRPLQLGTEPLNVRMFRIYDRWGKVVWSAEGVAASKGWDGTYNGTPAELSTYLYTIDVELPNGNEFVQKGDVTLVR